MMPRRCSVRQKTSLRFETRPNAHCFGQKGETVSLRKEVSRDSVTCTCPGLNSVQLFAHLCNGSSSHTHPLPAPRATAMWTATVVVRFDDRNRPRRFRPLLPNRIPALFTHYRFATHRLQRRRRIRTPQTHHTLIVVVIGIGGDLGRKGQLY